MINIAQVSFLPLLNDAIPNRLIGKNFRVIVNLTVNGGDLREIHKVVRRR